MRLSVRSASLRVASAAAGLICGMAAASLDTGVTCSRWAGTRGVAGRPRGIGSAAFDGEASTCRVCRSRFEETAVNVDRAGRTPPTA